MRTIIYQLAIYNVNNNGQICGLLLSIIRDPHYLFIPDWDNQSNEVLTHVLAKYAVFHRIAGDPQDPSQVNGMLLIKKKYYFNNIVYKPILKEEPKAGDDLTGSIDKTFTLQSDSVSVAGPSSGIPVPRPPESTSSTNAGNFTDPQNGGGTYAMVEENDERHQTTLFIDQTTGMKVEYPTGENDVIMGDMQENNELANYLSRPVKIIGFVWSEADPIGSPQSWNPWSLYFSTTSITNKLQNYAFIRAKLHLKVVVNASPFYYGAALFDYYPCQNWNGSTISQDTKPTGFIPRSQRPHVWVYPQTSQGGEIVCPFFYHKNWLDITSSTDVTNFGTLNFNINQVLASANGAIGTGATVTVYAWLEDVHLLGTTGKAALQSEYGSGPISKPAGVVSAALGALSNVPVIGKYALASSMAARTVGNIASLFGYTNTPNINDTNLIKIMPFPQFASTEISTPIERLALDPKNELTLSPDTTGTENQDELDIKHIVTRESYLFSATWDSSQVQNTTIFSWRVTSAQFDGDAAATNPYINSTPMGYLNNLFRYYRGDIIIRLRFVLTQYHKGRVLLIFDPRQYSGGTVETSTVYTQVIDIGNDNDVEFRVPYMNEYGWLKCRRPTYLQAGLAATELPYVLGSSGVSFNRDNDIGVVSLVVLNPLTAPIAVASIPIQVFIRAGDNFEFALPSLNSSTSTYTNYFPLQGLESVEFEKPSSYDIGSSSGGKSNFRYMHNMGEVNPSLRKLLHRTVYTDTICPNSSNTTDIQEVWRFRFPRLPSYFGFDPNGWNSAKGILVPGSNFPFNFVQNTYVSWIIPMFIGYRGSVNWSFNLCCGNNTVSDFRSMRTCITRAVPNYSSTPGNSGTYSAYARYFLANFKDPGTSGASLTNQITNTGMSINLPYYSRSNFSFTNPGLVNLGSSVDDSDIDTNELYFIFNPSIQSDAKYLKVDRWFSTGHDFNLFFFINCPSYQQTAIPASN